MNPADNRETPRAQGDILTAISNGMVAVLKKAYGRGPTNTKTYYQDDVVLCVLRGGFTRVERTLIEAGRSQAVMQQRLEFQEAMRERFQEIVERATGRQVIGFVSGSQKDPDLMCEVFILAPDVLSDEVAGDTGDLQAPPE